MGQDESPRLGDDVPARNVDHAKVALVHEIALHAEPARIVLSLPLQRDLAKEEPLALEQGAVPHHRTRGAAEQHRAYVWPALYPAISKRFSAPPSWWAKQRGVEGRMFNFSYL